MKEKNNLVLKFFILLSAIVFGLGVTKSAQATSRLCLRSILLL